MGTNKRVRMDLSGLRYLRTHVRESADEAVIATAYSVKASCEEHAPVDTKYLVSSIHVVTPTTSGYNISRALSELYLQEALTIGKTPKGVKISPSSNYRFFPEIRPDIPGQAWVVVGAMHGIANEEAVANRQPFMKDAVRDNRSTLTTQVRRVFAGLSVRAEITRSRITE